MKTIPLIRAFALFLTVTSTALHAQVPQIINYQGRVAVGSPPVNFEGAGAFKFALVNTDGTTSYWSNDGTSTAGSEPTAAVTLPVTKGLYSVLLGDATLPHMTAIPYSVSTHPDVRLRVWFDDGAHGVRLLTPDQRIAAVGYAMMAANVPDGTITGAKLAAAAVGSAHIAGGAIVPGNLSPALLSDTFWRVDGSSGTTPGGRFLGTTDNQPLELKVNNQRGLRLEYANDGSTESVNLIGGYSGNRIGSGTVGAVLAGGGASGSINSIGEDSDYSAVGGGLDNHIADDSFYATIAGGWENDIANDSGYSAVGGGVDNNIFGNSASAAIAGGYHNNIGSYSEMSVIGGGEGNIIAADSSYATIAGGGAHDIATNSDFSTVGGGWDNNIADNSALATIAGGIDNDIGTNSPHTTIGGGHDNNIAANSTLASIAGGIANGIGTNSPHTTIGGGYENNIADNAGFATIAGGQVNAIGANSSYGTVGGGYDNTLAADSWYATIVGGTANHAAAYFATVGGGNDNIGSGVGATVAGGMLNVAGGDTSFAAGQRAHADHVGSFVWADASVAEPFPSTAANQFSVRATGGVRFETGGGGLLVDGTVGLTTSSFQGDGSGLTNIPASAFVTAPPGMVLIPAGMFTMGNSVAADTDITNADPVGVTLSAFYLAVNEVTLSQWQVVYYWATSHGYSFTHAGAGKSANHPVHTVNWYDIVKWCNARSEMEHLTPCYTVSGATYQTGDSTPVCNWSASGYRLPSEAEWEKAARGGLSGQRFPWGDTITQNLANYRGETAYPYDLGPNGYNAIGSVGGTSPATSPVGTFAANSYGLNDMAGNVYEWCWDWLGTPYAGGSDPHGPLSGSYRVVRGGNWVNSANYCRVADRGNADPTVTYNDLGFRPARSSVP